MEVNILMMQLKVFVFPSRFLALALPGVEIAEA